METKILKYHGKDFEVKDWFSETDFIRKLVYAMVSSLQLEGAIERKADYAQSVVDENFPGRYQFSTRHDKQTDLVVYEARNVDKRNQLVISVSIDPGYYTDEDLDIILNS